MTPNLAKVIVIILDTLKEIMYTSILIKGYMLIRAYLFRTTIRTKPQWLRRAEMWLQRAQAQAGSGNSSGVMGAALSLIHHVTSHRGRPDCGQHV